MKFILKILLNLSSRNKLTFKKSKKKQFYTCTILIFWYNTAVFDRGVAKRSKAPDFDSGIDGSSPSTPAIFYLRGVSDE